MRAVGGLRGDGGAVLDDLRQFAAKDGKRAGEDEADARLGVADGFEQVARGEEVDFITEVGFGFGVAADDGSEMEDGIGFWRDDVAEMRGVTQVHFDAAGACVAIGRGRLDDIHQRELGVRPFGKQGFGKTLAEEACAAGDDDIHRNDLV